MQTNETSDLERETQHSSRHADFHAFTKNNLPITENVQMALFPVSSVKVYVTCVVPTVKLSPDR